MTDQIELPPVPKSPPVVTLKTYADMPPIFAFDRSLMINELLVDLNIRDEDVNEPLKVRWRIVGERPPGSSAHEYPCPDEPTVPGDGVTLKRTHTLKVQGSSLARGKCSRVDVIVSGSFIQCNPERDDRWDITTQDEDSVVGRLSFWVMETSDKPQMNSMAAQALLTSCMLVDYQPPSPTASATSAASLEQ